MSRIAGSLWNWLPVLAWMALILSLSSQSELPARVNPQTGETIRSTFTLAKAAHVVEYSVLALLLLRALHGAAGGVRWPLGRAMVATVLVAAIFGGLDELRQSLVPNREPRLTDVALDTASALVTSLVAGAWTRLRRKTSPPGPLSGAERGSSRSISPPLRAGDDVGVGPERACESKDSRAAQRAGG